MTSRPSWHAPAIALLGVFACLVSVPLIATEQDFGDWTDARREALLLNGEIVDRVAIGIGVTGTDRVTLDDGTVQHDAQIQTIDVYEPIMRFEDGTTELNFTDCYCYNIAGYRLDRLIGLNMVQVSVPRRDRGEDAAFTWWVDDYLMMEVDRHQQELLPPSGLEWARQVGRAQVFRQLIYDTDPNLTNWLITNDWQIWIIDFGRAFRNQKELRTPEDLPVSIERHVYDGLKSLTKDQLEETMDDLISGSQIDGILARRDLIVQHFDSLIAARGEALVLRD